MASNSVTVPAPSAASASASATAGEAVQPKEANQKEAAAEPHGKLMALLPDWVTHLAGNSPAKE
jgi:hypothetical protein